MPWDVESCNRLTDTSVPVTVVTEGESETQSQEVISVRLYTVCENHSKVGNHISLTQAFLASSGLLLPMCTGMTHLTC